MVKITNKELVDLSKLLKEKLKLLGDLAKNRQEKKNIKIIRRFIDRIRDGRIVNFIDEIKRQIRREENE